MPTGPVLDAIRTLARDPDPRPDGELVERFADGRDPAAFAELVRRHGRTVFGVCRRVLGHTQDAEDAFQAVWLVLARRAADVRPPGAVGPWLYGVAVRTAAKARALAMKRRLRQLAAAKPEAVEDRPDQSDLWPVLDEELARLPERYRRAVVACDLGGKSRSAAARDLGWPEGTVATRLAKGRELLAERLRRRGVTLSAAALAAALASGAAHADPPAALAAEALAAALEFASGAASAVPPVSRALAEGVMRTMTVSRWKLPAVVLMAAGLAVGGGLAAADRGSPDKPAATPAAPPPAAEGKPAGKDRMEWKVRAVLEHVGWLVGSVAYSPDGRTLYTGGSGGHVRAWDVGSGKEKWTAEVGGKFAAVAVSADGRTVAATVPGGVRLLAAADGKPTKTVKTDGDPRAVALSPDGKWVAASTGSSNGFWALDESGDASAIASVPVAGNPAASVAWSPDSLYLAYAHPTADGSGLVGMMGVIGETKPRNLPNRLGRAVTAVAWSKDGKTIAAGGADGSVILWDTTTFQEKSRAALGGRVAAVALTADGGRVAAAVVGMPETQKETTYYEDVFVWQAGNPPTKPEPLDRRPVGGVFQGVASVAFSPDGKSLASAFCDFDHLTKLAELVGKVRVWTLTGAEKPAAPAPAAAQPPGQTWKERATLAAHGGPVYSVAFARDGKSFATSGGDDTAVVWNTADLTPKARLKADKVPVAAVAFSPDGGTVAAATRTGIALYDAATGERKELLKDEDDALVVAFAPDGKRLAFSSGVKTYVRFLPPDAGTVSMEDPPGVRKGVPAGVAWSPDGKRLALIRHEQQDGKWPVVVWGAGSGEPMKVLAGHRDGVRAVAWSRDGRYLASAGGYEVIIWDATTFKELHRLDLGLGFVCEPRSLAFSPDGSTLAVGGTRPEDNARLLRQPGGHVFLCETATGKLRHVLGEYPRDATITVAFSPDGKTLLTGWAGPAKGKPAGGVVVWERVKD